MVRRLKKDVLLDLPAKRRQIIDLPANGAETAVQAEKAAFRAHEEKINALKKLAREAKKTGLAEYKAAVQALRDGRAVAFGEISKYRHETAIAKIPAVIEHVTEMLESVEKIIVFAHHHDVIDALMAAFGAQAVHLTGQDSQESRQAAVDRFQADPSCHIFVGSITAAGVGITLTAASTVIFAELDWVPGNLSQAEDRAHRIGQTDSVLVQHLVLDGSLDANMARTLVRKQEIISSALDADDAEIEEEEEGIAA
jgi:SWI/SNF-related matrix-associated actin-dependent regulator 1 of chromatin subfamily A